jgi:thiol:disulfide interchange protein DsbD
MFFKGLSKLVSIFWLCIVCNPCFSENLIPNTEPDFLPVHQAFRDNIIQSGNQVKVHFDIADHYYLYKDRFKFSIEAPTTATLSAPVFATPGELKQDENFGEVTVYHHAVDIELAITAAQASAATLIVEFQGCAEAGLCYPPTQIKQPLTNLAVSTASLTTGPVTPALDSSSTQSILNFLEGKSWLYMIGVFFLLGLGLTFTPCVLPMIPILSGVIAGQHQPLTARKGFILSSCFVLGMALTFAIAGLIVGMTGARLQIWMQDPIVLSVFAGLFVLLALSMFGFYEMQLPAFIRDRLHNLNQQQQGGHWLGVFMMGVLSALVVSPCVSAPLAAALLYIAQTGSPLLGALALLALGLGMGAPLIIIGTTGANILPRAGGWMDNVKAFFGVLLLAVGAWLIRTVLPDALMMLIWAALLIIPAMYLLTASTASGWSKLGKGLALIMLTYGVLLIIGAASGQTNPLKPLPLNTSTTSASAVNHPTSTGLNFSKVTTLAQLQQALTDAKNNQQPAMLDYYADWCIACVEMEHGAFQDPAVKTTLKDFKLIQVDLTNNPETDALLSKFNLIGPPSILFFDKNGQWLEKVTIMGQMDAEKFNRYIQQQVLAII